MTTLADAEFEFSRIGYGCNRLISSTGDPHDPEAIATAERMVNAAHAEGITLFDMAAMYSGGRVESVFGEVLARSPELRDSAVIQTKCGALDNPAFVQPGDPPFVFDCSRDAIIRSAEGSLDRLGVERIDILLLHWPDLLLEPDEVAEAFDRLRADGKVRAFGVSNHTTGQMDLLRDAVRRPILVDQVFLGLGVATLITAGLQQVQNWGIDFAPGHPALAGVVDYCRRHSIQLQTYASVSGLAAHGVFEPAADARDEVVAMNRLLTEVAERKGTSLPAIAVAWLLRHPAGIVPLIGSSRPANIVAACEGDRVTLERSEWFDLLFSAAKVEATAPSPA